MRVKMELGGEIDVLTPTELDHHLKKLEARLRDLPTMRILSSTADVTQAGTFTLDLGGPAEGKRWEVKTIEVSPPDPLTVSNTGSVTIFRRTSAGASNYVDRTDPTVGIPTVGTWTSEQFPVEGGERIFAVGSGLNVVQVTVTLVVRETTERRVEN